VSWYEALAYANWLGRVTGRAFGLPSKAQWERAARHTDGRRWPWGDEWRDGIVNSREAGVGQTTAVGCFPGGAAPCGAQDLSGNVWEWCSSRSRDEEGNTYPLPYDPDDGREDLSGSYRAWRVIRGGAFLNYLRVVRAAVRYLIYPFNWGSISGFGWSNISLRSWLLFSVS
jgi:formylglycine-generating enzyme required for sulfatase activity